MQCHLERHNPGVRQKGYWQQQLYRRAEWPELYVRCLASDDIVMAQY